MDDLAKQFMKSVSLSGSKAVDEDGSTPLLIATGDPSVGLDVIKALVSAGCDVNAIDKVGMSPLITSINFAEDEEIANYLIEKGADIHYKVNGCSIIECAANNEMEETVKLLVKKGVDVDTKHSEKGTILVQAIEDGAVSMVGTLLKLGANPDVRFKGNMTPLMLAVTNPSDAECEDVELIVDMLLEHGADILLFNDCFRNALIYAAKGEYIKIFHKLWEAGGDEDLEDSFGKTALHYAEKSGFL